MAFVILVDTALVCVLFVLNHRTMERYIKLEEWAEDWLKRLEQKVEAADMRSKLNAEQLKAMEDILPKDGNNEVLRHNVLLQQMNDEMERSLRMEKEWNDGVYAIMNYGKPNVEVNET
jgi:hypothetical protein